MLRTTHREGKMGTSQIENEGLYFFDGEWFDTNPKIIGPGTHAFWMASVVFDGARAFGGLAPDLDKHSQRLIRSARAIGLEPPLDWQTVYDLSVEGVRKLPPDAVVYIRPAIYAEEGFVNADPESSKFVLAILQSPMPQFGNFTACLSTLRRPARDMATTDAKAAALYPQSGRALREAAKRGFDNAVMLDPNGNVAEFATANLWFAKNGIAVTPAENGTFLSGITRARVRSLLQADGVEVQERSFTFDEVKGADEVFNTGNYGKVMPVTKIESRKLQPGPVARRAYDLYMDFAKSCNVI